jgi:hypothetical protein
MDSKPVNNPVKRCDFDNATMIKIPNTAYKAPRAPQR